MKKYKSFIRISVQLISIYPSYRSIFEYTSWTVIQLIKTVSWALFNQVYQCILFHGFGYQTEIQCNMQILKVFSCDESSVLIFNNNLSVYGIFWSKYRRCFRFGCFKFPHTQHVQYFLMWVDSKISGLLWKLPVLSYKQNTLWLFHIEIISDNFTT